MLCSAVIFLIFLTICSLCCTANTSSFMHILSMKFYRNFMQIGLHLVESKVGQGTLFWSKKIWKQLPWCILIYNILTSVASRTPLTVSMPCSLLLLVWSLSLLTIKEEYLKKRQQNAQKRCQRRQQSRNNLKQEVQSSQKLEKRLGKY